jgi:F plasmid transfer operon protein TraF
MRSSRAARGLAIAAALLLPIPQRAPAEEWSILGAKAMGMGGAGVASTRGGASTYWNPAALARSEGVRGTSGRTPDPEHPGFDISGGINPTVAAPGGALKAIDDFRVDFEALDTPEFRDAIDNGSPLSADQLQRSLRILGRDIPALDKKGEGVLVDGIGGLTARIGRFGLGALSIIDAASTPVVDFQNLGFGTEGVTGLVGPGQDRSGQLSAAGQSLADSIAASGAATQNQSEELVFQAETAGVNTADRGARRAIQGAAEATASGDPSRSVLNNRSGAAVRGLFIQELSVGYGQPIGDWLSLGVTAKGMHAYGTSKAFVATDLPDTGEVVHDTISLNDTESSFNFGVDAGGLITPTDWLALGITGKNLSYPAFKRQGGGHYVLEPNARAGVAVYPLSFLELAADIDLFVNQSNVLPGYESQVVGGGAQIDLGIVAIRAGLSKNIADPSEDVLLHAGLALRIWKFSLEAAIMTTPSLETINSDEDIKIPQRAGASLTLGMNIAF